MLGDINNPLVTKTELPLKKRDSVYCICSVCNKIFKTRYENTSFICRTCKGIHTKKEQGNLSLSEEAKCKISNALKKSWEIKIKNGENKVPKERLEKRKKTCLKKYGAEFPLQSKEIREKIQKTNIERYGFIIPTKNKDISIKISKAKKQANEKRKETCLQKYGVEFINRNDEIRHRARKKYSYDGLQFDSSWELYFYIYFKDLGKIINRESVKLEYNFNGETRYYFPDFEVDNKLYEIKSLFFFDENNNLINPYDNSLSELYKAKQNCMIKNNVDIITDISLYKDYVEKKYTKDFIKLFRNDLAFPYPYLENTDLGIIRHFHKSIYEASKKGQKSPLDAWQDKELVKQAALNRLKYVGACTPTDILNAFSVAKIASKISVFKPWFAKELIQTYLNDYDTIIDPFSGFSGRLIGSMNCNKHYIGYDINEKHVQESNEIIKYKNYKNCSVDTEDLINAPVRDYSKSNCCLFTCPPYGGKEHWNENNDEVEKTCDEWIDLCLKKHKNCKKYLFVVDKTEKYKKYIVQKIINKSHFGKNNEYIILI